MSTIVSISTALGKGAISIVRLSGDEAIDIVNKAFKGKQTCGGICRAVGKTGIVCGRKGKSKIQKGEEKMSSRKNREKHSKKKIFSLIKENSYISQNCMYFCHYFWFVKCLNFFY